MSQSNRTTVSPNQRNPMLFKDSIIQVPYGSTKRMVLNDIKTLNSVTPSYQKIFSKIMTMKQKSPYGFRDSDRLREYYEQQSIRKGIQSPFKQDGALRMRLSKRSSTPQKDPIIAEDNSCFITQTSIIFPNILNRTRDHLDLGRYKAARSVEHSRGRHG